MTATPRSDILAAAVAIIEDELEEPQLGPKLLCARLQVTRPTLYRAFAELGGVATFVRTRRLERVREILMHPDAPDIGRLGKVYGFKTASHLSRTFTLQYGVRPGRWREYARQVADV